MSKYKSITTPSIHHDVYNILTELIYLNRFGNTGEFPWRDTNKKYWTNTIAIIKKLMRDFDITPDQMAFYIYKCRPKELDKTEFAKATVLPKILFKAFSLVELVSLYREKFNLDMTSTLVSASYKQTTLKEQRPKTLLELMKELENDQSEKRGT